MARKNYKNKKKYKHRKWKVETKTRGLIRRLERKYCTDKSCHNATHEDG